MYRKTKKSVTRILIQKNVNNSNDATKFATDASTPFPRVMLTLPPAPLDPKVSAFTLGFGVWRDVRRHHRYLESFPRRNMMFMLLVSTPMTLLASTICVFASTSELFFFSIALQCQVISRFTVHTRYSLQVLDAISLFYLLSQRSVLSSFRCSFFFSCMFWAF